MNINLDNYESFFLLYVDNELSAEQKEDVEDFLRNHPYLQEEFDQLKETVLQQPEHKFEFKSSLLKPALSEELLQENMLLHLDGELAGEKKKGMEELLLKDDGLQKEWALLKRTKLDKEEHVAFPNRNSLYRHEGAKILTGRFVRLAVAALFIGAGFFAATRFFNQADEIPVQVAGNQETKGVEAPIETNAAVQPANEVAAATIPVEPKNAGTAIAVPGVKKIMVSEERVAVEPEKNQSVATAKKVKTPPATVDHDPVVIGERNRNIARLIQPENDNSSDALIVSNVKHRPANITDINVQPVENLFAKHASSEEDDDDHIFMIDEDKVSRTKAAGFIKKLKRTVERTTKIKPGNSLRIAGFEFAVK